MFFFMTVFFSLGTDSLKGQPNNLLRDLTKRDNKIYIINEAVDPAENSEENIKYIEDNLLTQMPKIIANLSYWKIVNSINEADFVMVYTCYKIYGFNVYGGRCKFFDNKMNFLYAPVFKGGFTWKKLPSHLQNAEISRTSPFYVASKETKKFDEDSYSRYNNLLIESIKYKQNKKILEYVDKCISINPELPELYEIKAGVLIDMNKTSLNTVNKLEELEPLNSNLEFFYQFAGYKQMQNAAKWIAISSALNSAATTYAAIQATSASSNTSSTSSSPAYNSASSSSQNTGQKATMREEKCSFCQGTGISPINKSIAGYGSFEKHWCDVCKDWVTASHGYHPSCPNCRGKGYILKPAW